MIAAVMGRTSKEVDDAYSVSSQIDAGLAYAATNSLTVPREYIFPEDFTGRVLDRPELSKIRRLVKDGKIQALIIHSTDRLARRVSVGEILLDELFDNGVQLHNVSWGSDVKNTPEDRLRFNFETTFSGFERDKIVERTTRGKQKKASQGFIVGNNHPAYGLKLNNRKDNFELAEEAAIARDVLRMYGIQHLRTADIVRYLEEQGYDSPGVIRYEQLRASFEEKYQSGRISEEDYEKKKRFAERERGRGKWSLNSVYRIVSKVDLYAGSFTFTVSGKEYTVSVPAIISEEEAEEVRRMAEVGRKRFARKRTTKYDFLMARRLSCAMCTYSYQVNYDKKGYCYYRCLGTNKKADKVCSEMPVPRNKVDEKAKEFIRDLLLNPRRLFAWWQEQHAQTVEGQEQLLEDIAALQNRSRITTEKYHRTLDRLTDNLDGDETAYYTQQRDSLKQLLTEYREGLELLTAKQEDAADVPEELITDFMAMGVEYREVLETSTAFTFWRGLVDDLDITGLVGTENERRFVDFVVFGKTRKRFYLTPKLLPEFHQEEADLAKTDILHRSRTRHPARA